MEDDDHHRGPEISPLFIGLVGILAGAIIVATLHCVTMSWCRLRQSSNSTNQPQIARINRRVEAPSSSTSTNSSSTVNLITVYRYSKECRESSTCAVCLSEFTEGEEVRVLPECAHQFHALCVEMWLFSHPSCPLCRAKTTALQQHVVVSLPDPPPELSRMPDFGG
ncbi:RING-H2 finger protein ATL51-like [Cornus florida]|uniref:RING-H2 finger protein ATL51-like n=1 Tax=Cornus florida TaxID=4283 RepID=UPI00289D0645|nr:RING-H2 finger protein ATL51-like [Cornus florida]